MIKFSVLGKGLTGIFSALRLQLENEHLKQDGRPQIEIEVLHDKEVPPVPFGQGTLPNVPVLLWNAFRFDMHNNQVGATPKLGILYENWGKLNHSSFHAFAAGISYGIHYEVDKIQEFICNNSNFTIRDQKVDEYDEVDADYIIDCRGYPKNFDDYEDLPNPLNSVILGEVRKPDPTQLWSGHIATQDGWMFSIPLQNFISYGYMYNSIFTDKETAISNFQALVKNVEIIADKSFKSYIAKSPIIDGRIFLNGNRLYFLEPMEANALAVHGIFVEEILRAKLYKMHTDQYLHKSMHKIIDHVKSFILYHYKFGSKWDNDFWKYAMSLEQHIDPALYQKMEEAIKSPSCHIPEMELFRYGIWGAYSISHTYNKFNVKH